LYRKKTRKSIFHFFASKKNHISPFSAFISAVK